MSISNLYIDQGSDFSTNITINDSAGAALDLTNYTASAQIRKTYSSSTFTGFTVVFDADRLTGKITLSLTNAQTSALNPGSYVYDGKEFYFCPIFDVPILERTGCGDSYTTGFIVALIYKKKIN